MAGLLVVPRSSPAQAAGHETDTHLNDAAAPLYVRSPFAHGYIHGYEDGFHSADQDLQLGRLARGMRTKPPSHPENRIHSTSPESLHAGYEEGFVAGYRDSAAGREFRAITALRNSAADLFPNSAQEAASTSVLPQADSDASDKTLDQAFRDGYVAGQTYIAGSERTIQDFGYVTAFCLNNLYHGKKKPTAAEQQNDIACPAYTSGFRLGYADGLTQKSAKTTASTK